MYLTSLEKETKEEKRISGENLTGYIDIVCKFVLCTFNSLNQVISCGCWYEFYVVYVQQGKSQYFSYYNIWNKHLQEQE